MKSRKKIIAFTFVALMMAVAFVPLAGSDVTDADSSRYVLAVSDNQWKWPTEVNGYTTKAMADVPKSEWSIDTSDMLNMTFMLSKTYLGTDSTVLPTKSENIHSSIYETYGAAPRPGLISTHIRSSTDVVKWMDPSRTYTTVDGWYNHCQTSGEVIFYPLAVSDGSVWKFAKDLNTSDFGYYNAATGVFVKTYGATGDILSLGTLYGMGYNNHGQMGDGTTTNVTTPKQIGASLGIITEIACSSATTFFLTVDGKLYGMGHNDHGQIGDGTTTDVTTPKQIGASLGKKITKVVCSSATTFFLTEDRKLYGMGNNANGQMGDGTTTDVTTPKQIGASLGEIVDVACSSDTTFFITFYEKLYGCGYNANGQIGTSTTTDIVTTPRQINSGSFLITKVACSEYTTFYIDESNRLYGCGDNTHHQIESGTSMTITSPTGMIYNIRDVVCSGENTFAIDLDRHVWGIGSNDYGQQGDGTTTEVSSLKKIDALKNTAIDSVICGGHFTFFLTVDGKLYGTGQNFYGVMGDGTTTDVTTPKQIGASLGTIIKAVCSADTLFFLTDDGKLYGCGSNSKGQQGDGTTTKVTTPKQIGASLGSVSDIICSDDSTLFAIAYVPPTYTVTGQSNNTAYGAVSPSEIADVLEGSNVSISTNTLSIKDGATTVGTFTATATQDDAQYHYAFDHWSVQAGATITEDTTITAYFVRSAQEYTVTFDAQGGTVTPISATGSADTPVELPTPTYSGFTFDGWYTQATGGTKVGDAGSSYVPTEDVTLYAVWHLSSYDTFHAILTIIPIMMAVGVLLALWESYAARKR